MELRHLRYFVAVAEELHFTRAAERLGMAQPPLSQQIRGLERELGVQLFRRTKRKVELTEVGRVFLEGARRVIREAERAAGDAERAARGEIGHLEIGFVGTAAVEALPGILRRYRERFPDVRLGLHQHSTTEQVSMLRAGAIHIGLVRQPVRDAALAVETVAREATLAVVPEDHRLADRDQIDLGELADERFILFPRALGPGPHDLIVGLCNLAGFTPRIDQEAVEMHTITGLVAAGLGVSLVPESTRQLRRDGVRYLALRGTAPIWELAVARRRNEESALIDHFVDAARGLVGDV
jgi:DNA-binding transcriptional LysR family regulator